MRLNFDSQQWKFNVYSKTANKKKKKKKKIQRKICHFLYNLISIANGKFSLLIQEYP